MYKYRLKAIKAETPKALLVSLDNIGDVWLPKYLIDSIGNQEITIKPKGYQIVKRQANKFTNTGNDNSWRYITVFADASFKDGIYGAGIWIKYTNNERERITKTLLLGINGKCKNNTEAEQIALQTGLDFVMQVLNPPITRFIVLQSDCQHAIRTIKRPTDRKHIYTKWVKGHQGGKNKRSYVNELCDKVASDMRLQYHKKKFIFNPETPRELLLDMTKYK